MTKYIEQGNSFIPTPDQSVPVLDALPLGTYTVKQNPMTNEYYLEKINDLRHVGKIYGSTSTTAHRVLETFEDRANSTGILLVGEKGSGKTLLARLLSEYGSEKGMSTIVINQPHMGENFNAFIQLIDQPTVILFDEFEKVYDKEQQEKMLTLLDGVYPSKKLFVLTSNDQYRIDQHMKNRPGRIFYRIQYSGLEQDFIVEYCNDNLKDKSMTEAVCRVTLAFHSFNFDMLKALVEEMNRYGESPQEALLMLNTKPDEDTRTLFNFEFEYQGVVWKPEWFDNGDAWVGNPFIESPALEFRRKVIRKDGDAKVILAAEEANVPMPSQAVLVHEYDEPEIEFDISELVSLDAATGKFTYQNAEGAKLTLTKPVNRNTTHWAAF